MGFLRMRPRAIRAAALTGTAVLVVAGIVPMLHTSAASATEVYALPSSGSLTVKGHGNGHGHGLSQYGAQGAAIAGLSAAAITAFYYNNATLKTLSSATPIRVLISGASTYTTITAQAGLALFGASGRAIAGAPNPLPTSGVTKYRLVPAGSGLKLQRLSGATWAVVSGASGLPARVDFHSTSNAVRLYLASGASTVYRGAVGAVRSGAGEITVNRLGLDQYTEGVVPREVPASWRAAAVQAQAIAARTYGEYEREHAGTRAYDICDSDQCQVYGGKTHYDAAGHVLWSDDPAALSGNAGKVLQYRGATIFAQYSASDGGWTADGGQPYLTAKADRYDNAASGDPYLNWTRSVSVSSIANRYGLARVTSIGITQRDGHGDWGGRVLQGYVEGVTAGGHSQRISATGFGLQSAMGLLHNWFTIVQATVAAPTGVTAQARDSGAQLSWHAPSGAAAITGYRLTSGSQQVTVGAAARSATIIGLANGVKASVAVRALGTTTSSAAVVVSVTPAADPVLVHPLVPKRLFDTRPGKTLVDPSHPLATMIGGHGDVPGLTSRAQSVQFALTIVAPTASGTLHVQTAGAPTSKASAIAYRKGRTVTVSVSVPTTSTTTVVFRPTAGSMGLVADQMSYGGPDGAAVAAVPPLLLADISHVPMGQGAVIPVRGVDGVAADASAVLLSVAAGPVTGSGWLRLWPDGSAAPAVSHVSVTSDGSGTNTVLVPLGANGAVRVGSSTAALGAQVSVVGYVAPAGAGRGLLETMQVTPLADTAAKVGASLSVGAKASTLAVLGRAHVPASGVAGVLLQVTVSGSARPGYLYAYAAGSRRPAARAMSFPAHTAATSTIVVQPGTSGAIALQTSGLSASVSADVVGYLTAT